MSRFPPKSSFFQISQFCEDWVMWVEFLEFWASMARLVELLGSPATPDFLRELHHAENHTGTQHPNLVDPVEI
jgi:hypothetical protein